MGLADPFEPAAPSGRRGQAAPEAPAGYAAPAAGDGPPVLPEVAPDLLPAAPLGRFPSSPPDGFPGGTAEGARTPPRVADLTPDELYALIEKAVESGVAKAMLRNRGRL